MSKLDNYQKSPYLLYGDYFVLAGYLRKHPLMRANINGVLSATGFTDNRICFQTLPFNLIDLANQRNNDEKITEVRNYRDFIFQVWPRLNFEAHKEHRRLKKMKHKYDKLKNSISDDDQALIAEYEYNLEKARNRSLEEAASNKELIETYQGTAVSYGSEIQLMHVDSESFANGKVTTAETDKSAFTFILSDDFNAGMIFRILPKYQIRHEGDPIHYDEEVFIQNTKLNCFVNFCRDGRIDLDIPLKEGSIQPSSPQPYKTMEFRKLGTNSVRFEAVLSQYKETNWRMLFYGRVAKGEDQEKKGRRGIMGGDLIRLRHMGIQGYIAADIPYQQENPEVYVRTYTGEFSDENKSANEIWEVEQVAVKGRGSEITTGNRSLYKLRHYITGRIMILDEVQMDQPRVIPLLAQDKDEKAVQDLTNCVSFIPTVYQKNPNVIHGNSYALSFVKGQNLFLRILPEITPANSVFNNYTTQQTSAGRVQHHLNTIKLAPRQRFNELQKDTKQLSTFFTPLKDNEIGVKRKPTYIDEQKSSEHTFFVEKLEDSEKKDVLFVASALTRLHYLRDVIKAQQTSYLVSDYLIKVLNTLERLIFFVVKVEDINPDPFICEGFTWSHRQRLLKDMKLIEVLTDILFYPFALEIYSFQKIPNLLMIQVFQLSYKLIKHTIREYRPNELYASQWLDLFIYQSMFSDSKYDLLAEPTLTELIDNNKRILESKITSATISKFVGMLRSQHPHQKYVNLLRALTVCDGEPMMKNQDAISTLIFEDENTRDQICYRVEFRENKQIYVDVVPYGECIELRSFQEEANRRGGNDMGVYDYFISMIYLLADLCLSRNYIAIDGLKGIYSYNICFEILSSQDYPLDIRSAFAKLFNHLWIDKTYQPVNIPNFLVTWDEISSENCTELINSSRDSHEFDTFKAFLQDYFQRTAERGYLRAFEEETNKMTYILLENCQLLVSFGFFSTAKDIENLIRPLLKILNGLKDVTTLAEDDLRKGTRKTSSFSLIRTVTQSAANVQYMESFSSRYQETSESANLMQIKLKVLEIIEIVMNFFQDMQIRSFLAEFKKQHETQMFKKKKANSSVMESSPQEWVETIHSKEDLDVESYSHTPFSLVLIDLLLYENKALQKLAFQTLYNQHTRRSSLKDALSLVHLVDDQETINNIQIIRKLGERIQELAESTEKWYGKSEHTAEKLTEEVLNSIRTLAEFLKMTKDGALGNGSTIIIKEQTNEGDTNEEVDEIFEFGTGPHPDYQKILRYLNTYKGVLEILNYDLQGRFESDESNLDSSKRLVLKACVKFLARFASQDKANQEIVNRNNSLLMKMLKKDPTLGLESIIVELFCNNKTLLSDSSAVENYLAVVVKLVEYIPNSDLRRCKLLLTFNSLMKYKDHLIKKNQTLVINYLSRKEYATLLPDFEIDRTWETFEEEFQNYEFQLQENISAVTLPRELDYLVSLLDVLAVSCEGKNAATESKCQFLFPLKVLKGIYNIASKCYYVKYAVMYFLHHVYLDTEKDTLTKDEHHISEMFVSITEDLQVLLDSGWSSYDLWMNKGIINSKRVEEVFVFEGIILNLISLFKKKNAVELPNYEFILEQTVLKVKKFRTGADDYTRQKDVKKLYRILEKNHLQKIEELNLLSELPANQKGNLSFVKGLNSPTINRTFLKNKTMLTKFKVVTPRAGPRSIELSDDQSMLQKLLAKVQSLDDEIFDSKVELEFDSLIQKIMSIERHLGEENPVSFRRVIEALIDLIGREEDSVDDDLKAVGIRIFRRIIDREVPGNKPAAEWESKDWVSAEKRVINRQNDLTDFGVVGLVCQLLPKSSNTAITEELILLAISLLVGGNQNAQKVFLEFMINDTQNLFILSIRKLIVSGFEEMKKEMIRLNEKSAKKNIFGEEDEQKKAVFLPTDHVVKTQGGNDDDTQFKNEIKDNIETLVKLFRLLQLFCEGHNFDMQNHLRIQLVSNGTTNVKTFDFIFNSATWFAAFIKFANADCLDFGNQLLDFLVEAVQGPCPENQRTLVASKIINSCMDYATMFHKISEKKRRGFTNEEKLKALTATTAKAMKLLYSLLEGNTNQSIIHEMCFHIDFKFVTDKLNEEFESFCKRKEISKLAKTSSINDALKDKEDPFDDEIFEAFGVFILLLTLADNNKSIADMLNKKIEDKSAGALSFFKSNIASIEIIFHEQLIKVYFPLYPETRFLSQTSRKHLMESVKRDSPNEKILGLLNSIDYLFDEINHLSKLSRWRPSLSSKRLTFLRNLSTIIAFLINVIILFTYVRVFDNSVETGRNGMLKTAYIEIFGGKLKVKDLVIFLGIIQVIITGLVTVSWVALRGPLLLRKKWRELNSKQKLSRFDPKNLEETEDDLERIISRSENQLDDIRNFSTSKTTRLLLQYGPDCSVFIRNGKKDFGNTYTTALYYWINATFLCSEGIFQNLMFYLIISILGLFGVELVYSLQLLDVVNRFPNLKNVVRAVTLNGRQLIMTSFLGLIFIFIYALFGFWFLDDLYYSSDLEERTCSSMLQCFITTLDYGLRSPGGIGDVISTPSYGSQTRYRWWTKIIWELSFFIVVDIIFLNLILATIIATFGTLRSKKETIDHDMYNKCYICDIDRWKLDKDGKGFLNHIQYNHHLWNYIHYLYMLKKKDPLEYNGIESYIAEKSANQNISWFPNGRSLDLIENEEEKENGKPEGLQDTTAGGDESD